MGGTILEKGGLKALDGSVISHRGMMLMAYQRADNISRKSLRAWEDGDPSHLDEEVRNRRDEIFSQVVAAIGEEHLPVRNYLKARGLAPRHVIDIGCGTAISDALLKQDHDLRATLIDIEETPAQYHQWNADGAGYASLADAKAFLCANGFKTTEVTTINPRKAPAALARVNGDLVTSFISCGFHYPVTDYVDLMLKTMEASGTVILDIRHRYLRSPDEGLKALLDGNDVETLVNTAKYRRMAFRKAAP